MSGYQSMIDNALDRAKARISGGVAHTKEASATEGGGLIKEASEVADALEYMSLAMADDGSAAGSARQEMLVNFFAKSAAGGGPKESATTTAGTQGQAPTGSNRTIQPGGKPGATNPEVSDAHEGTQAPIPFHQSPPSVAPTPKSANASLYDVLMTSKEAAGGGPLEMDAEQALPQTPKKNEGKQHADKLLGSNTAPVAATKREAKAPTRPRLAEAWASTNDTVGDATAKKIWPSAASKGDMKVASISDLARAFRKEAAGPSTYNPKINMPSGAVGRGLQKNFDAGMRSGAARGAGGALALTGLAVGGKKIYDKMKAKPAAEKETTASLGDYSEVFETALRGDLGQEAQDYALSVESMA